MAIPDEKLKAWSNQGAVDASKRTHEAVRDALDAHTWPSQYVYDVYLQGSYRNSTNIRGDSDVDIVAELESSFSNDLSRLDPQERVAFHNHYSDATYGWQDFRAHVLTALVDAFGTSSIFEGSKAITVFGTGGRLDADVLVCQERRYYAAFPSKQGERYLEGVRFKDLSNGRWIENFPKQHIENGFEKNSEGRTNHWYKPTVRMFKNARTYLVQRGDIGPDLAPSYFVECLMWNVPDIEFGYSYAQSFQDSLKWLSSADVTNFKCQNDVVPLFGATPEQWSHSSARDFVDQLELLWDYWY
jgi:Nucleotidyltransferase domain